MFKFKHNLAFLQIVPCVRLVKNLPSGSNTISYATSTSQPLGSHNVNTDSRNRPVQGRPSQMLNCYSKGIYCFGKIKAPLCAKF